MNSQNLDKVKTQMRRGVLEMCILSITSQEEVYTSDIIEKLKQSELIVKEGTLYPLLSRLKNAGLLQYQWQESATGPPRKYYLITEEGRKFLKHLNDQWNDLVTAVSLATKIHIEK